MRGIYKLYYGKDVIIMFNELRFKMANKLLDLAVEKINDSDFKKVKKGMKYIKYAVIITPPGPELNYFRNGLLALINQHTEKS